MLLRALIACVIIALLLPTSGQQKISRNGGNIIRNLTKTHSYENNIVTSPLDISPVVWMYRGIRELYNVVLGPTGGRARGERYQYRVPKKVQFPCDVNGFRSRERPTSVHRLRPGDFDIIAAMGDSITSATGANSRNVIEGLVENRGLSWCIGGQGSWRSTLTLPNILKEFNPRLFGYSLADAFNIHRPAQFNVAENIATCSDMPYSAKVLLERMKNDPRVNIKEHWKLVTIMVGGNDFCSDICYLTNATQWLVKEQERYLMKTLKYMRDRFPRTLVNLVPSPLVNLCFSMDKQEVPYSCYLARPVECSCLFGPVYSHNRNHFRYLERQFVKMMERISFHPDIHSDDFSVVYQPFLKDASVVYPDGLLDINLMGIDCIHLSQKGHATAGNGLWNNMLEPVGRKSLGFRPLFEKFRCPSENFPYVYTNFNSNVSSSYY